MILSIFSMIAEEVDNVLSDLVTYDKNGSVQGLKYEKMGVFALKGLQELASEVDTQQTQILDLADNQNLIVGQLSDKLADQNLSIQDKLTIIGENLNELSQNQLTTIGQQIAQNQASLADLRDDHAQLE